MTRENNDGLDRLDEGLTRIEQQVTRIEQQVTCINHQLTCMIQQCEENFAITKSILRDSKILEEKREKKFNCMK